MSRSNARIRLSLALALITLTTGGCGWTARDSFFSGRNVSFTATAGDGSVAAIESPTPSLAEARLGLASDR